jgi:preprotein translocase subunit SecG
MLYEFLVSILIFICLLLILIILIQQGKSSMGLGSLGGGAQMLFGGSGGQDMFQKVTWVLGACFMGLSLILALMKSHTISSSRYLQNVAQPVAAKSAQVPAMPTHESTPSTPE